MMQSNLDKQRPESNALVIGATCAALLSLAPIAAHQLGLLKHLPDPEGSIFASDEITESRTAHPLGVPDSLLGLASYSTTLALALLSRSHPKARPLLAAKLLADGSVATFNVVRQVVSFRKLCSWCTGTAICTVVMVYAGRTVVRKEVSELLHKS